MGYTIFVEARTKAEANELGFKLLKKCKQSSNYRIAIGDNPERGAICAEVELIVEDLANIGKENTTPKKPAILERLMMGE